MKKIEFIEYCKQERREFVNKFIQTNPDAKERVMAEDLLIAYDQLLDMNEQMIYALIEAKESMNHWLFTYAPEFSDYEKVKEASKIINLYGGTLAYITKKRIKIETALKKAGCE